MWILNCSRCNGETEVRDPYNQYSKRAGQYVRGIENKELGKNGSCGTATNQQITCGEWIDMKGQTESSTKCYPGMIVSSDDDIQSDSCSISLHETNSCSKICCERCGFDTENSRSYRGIGDPDTRCITCPEGQRVVAMHVNGELFNIRCDECLPPLVASADNVHECEVSPAGSR